MIGIVANVFEIPLSPRAEHFNITLNNGVEYTFNVRYINSDTPMWILDVLDPATQIPLVAGLPLITGTNILRQLGYLTIGGVNSILAMYTDTNVKVVPTFTNLGVDSHMLYGNSP